MRCLLICTWFWVAVVAPARADDDLRRNAVVQAIEKSGPAVVNIYTEEMIRQRDPSGDFFRDFFEPRYRKSMETSSLGSGVIIDSSGHVLTNFHVVQRFSRIKVALVDKREFEASVVGVDPDLDLAVLKLKADTAMPFIPMGDSTDILIGETVIAIGNPFGLSNTVTTGVVSATHRNINAGDKTFYDFIQTDASINPGNSGGPLLNINGVMIGVNTAIYASAQGIGFAIPVNRARRIVEDLIEYGSIQQAYLGMDLGVIRGKDLERNGLAQKKAVHVVAVEAGGPAELAGVQVGDIVLSVEGFPIESPADYGAKMRDFTSGNRVRMQVQRAKENVDIEVEAGKVPLHLADRIVEGQLGLSVAALDAKLARRYQLATNSGVVVTAVRGGTAAARARMRQGDLILKVNDTDVVNIDEFRKAVLRARRRGEVVFLVKRGRSIGDVSFKL